MKRARNLTRISGLIVMTLAIGLSSAAAEDRDRRRDHDAARQGLEQNQILSLEKILAVVRQQVSGEIAGIELENKRGGWLYEIKVISPSGRMQEIYVDARTGEILKSRSK